MLEDASDPASGSDARISGTRLLIRRDAYPIEFTFWCKNTLKMLGDCAWKFVYALGPIGIVELLEGLRWVRECIGGGRHDCGAYVMAPGAG